jgi:dTDP-4-amino-4,6-dideoxygalactose transaminase
MIDFNKPTITGRESKYVNDAISQGKLSGDGQYTKKCHKWFEVNLPCKKALLTPSCTAALEMAAILIDISPGDEVILPSYTFVSTANAFALRGAKIVFVDVRPDTMNINETLIEAAITSNTKAIVPVHYAGVACEMDTIMDVASKYGLYVIEDAAQGMMSTYKGLALGTIGHLGTFSFHETKNYTSGGEGGLLIINDEEFISRAEVIREKGTNRSQFLNGTVDKYTWVDLGSSYLPGELQCAYLYGQLDVADDINSHRLELWSIYHRTLEKLRLSGHISLPTKPDECIHNAHMYYIKTQNEHERKSLMEHLNTSGIKSSFHYVPLHSSPAGVKYGLFNGPDIYTTIDSSRLLRLPLFYNMIPEEVDFVCNKIMEFYS